MNDIIEKHLTYIYGEKAGRETARELASLLEEERTKLPQITTAVPAGLPLDQTDVFLITYGDSLTRPHSPPLTCLKTFVDTRLTGAVSGLHILPFFPYSSDDGFSVMDYYQVNQSLGTWDDIAQLGGRCKLMSDLVLNHCSVQGEWFTRFLRGDNGFNDFFITADPTEDLSYVFRPRTHPLLTPFETVDGTRYVWTTFSADQADLNFAQPRVLLEMIRVLLFHISMGIRVIRLDAIAYLWKEKGHSCLHHPKTHAVVKLLRAMLDEYAPGVLLLTETNVPHKENISYFGNGTDEAHMVYNFSLPPLVLDAFLRQGTGHLQQWAAGLPAPNGHNTFFNFLASHDGIGVLPARGILTHAELGNLAAAVADRGGRVNHKSTSSGKIPYELNITYVDAIAEKSLGVAVRARKFLASQAIMLCLPGVPGIYIGSLIGSENWEEGVRQTGTNRTINRQKLDLDQVLKELQAPGTFRHLIFDGYLSMLRARSMSKAFHPAGGMRVIPMQGSVFTVLRTAPDNREGRVLCMVNTGNARVVCDVPWAPLGWQKNTRLQDLISRRRIEGVGQGESLRVTLEPFAVIWITSYQ